MKNTSNVKRYYAMSLIDGRTILVTRELLTNPDYRVITEDLAKEIESGNKDWRKVAFELRQRDSMNPDELVKRAEQEKVKNMRKSAVTRENVEQFETKISEDELGTVFNGEGVPDEQPKKTESANHEGGDEAPPKAKAGKGGKGKSRKEKPETEPPAETQAGESEDDDQDAEPHNGGESENLDI